MYTRQARPIPSTSRRCQRDFAMLSPAGRRWRTEMDHHQRSILRRREKINRKFGLRPEEAGPGMAGHRPAVPLAADQPVAPLSVIVRRGSDLLKMDGTLGHHRAGLRRRTAGRPDEPDRAWAWENRTPTSRTPEKTAETDTEDQTDSSGRCGQLHGSVTSWAVNW